MTRALFLVALLVAAAAALASVPTADAIGVPPPSALPLPAPVKGLLAPVPGVAVPKPPTSPVPAPPPVAQPEAPQLLPSGTAVCAGPVEQGNCTGSCRVVVEGSCSGRCTVTAFGDCETNDACVVREDFVNRCIHTGNGCGFGVPDFGPVVRAAVPFWRGAFICGKPA